MAKVRENLDFAVGTINALKKERDNLRDRLRMNEEQKEREDRALYSGFIKAKSINKEELKEELRGLRRMVGEKDKMISELEKKFQGLMEMGEHEGLEGLENELKDRERKIRIMENRIKGKLEEISGMEETVVRMKEVLRGREIELEYKENEIKIIVEENEQGRRLCNMLNGLAKEIFGKSASGDKDWEFAIETLTAFQAAYYDKHRKIQQLKATLKELLIKTSRENNEEIDKEISKELINLVENVHSSQIMHEHFRKRLGCSNRFKQIIEARHFQEGIMRVLKLTNDLIADWPKLPYENNSFCPKHSVNQVSSLHKSESVHFSTPNKYGSLSKSSSTTQTPDYKQFAKPTIAVQSPSLVHANGVQAEPYMRSPKASSHQLANYPSLSHSESGKPRPCCDCNVEQLESNKDRHIRKESYLKLYAESQELLESIDRQNLRLSQINSNISQIVPGRSKQQSVLSTRLKGTNIENNVKKHYCEDVERKNEAWRVEEESLTGESKLCYCDRSMQEDSLDAKADDLHSYNNGETCENQGEIEGKKEKLERKRSEWDLSALNTPSAVKVEEPAPEVRVASPKAEVKEKLEKKRTLSPTDRFDEYARPKLRQEPFWGSVADYFKVTE
jgi:hypothetical protein